MQKVLCTICEVVKCCTKGRPGATKKEKATFNDSLKNKIKMFMYF